MDEYTPPTQPNTNRVLRAIKVNPKNDIAKFGTNKFI